MNCKFLDKCGACEYIGMDYNEYLKKKKEYTSKVLKEVCDIDSITGMDIPYHYRNKVTAVFSYEKGKILSGTYRRDSHILVSHDSCLIEDELADKIIVSIRKLLQDFKIKVYDEDTDYGYFRHVLIRRGKTSGEILVVLVCVSNVFPSKNEFVKALLKLYPEIKSIVLNINNKNTSLILGDKNITLYGPGYIQDELCGNKYRISPNSFYQINSIQTEKLYNKAIALANLRKSDIVLDLYCGIGTIGITASKYAGTVIGVEINEDAVRDAKKNIKLNNISNVRVEEADAKIFMGNVVREEASSKVKTEVSSAFIDPPREGCDKEFINSLMKLSPKKIVYISCNPETLKRDLLIFRKDYNVEKAYLFDMFPWTEHVECVVLLSRL